MRAGTAFSPFTSVVSALMSLVTSPVAAIRTPEWGFTGSSRKSKVRLLPTVCIKKFPGGDPEPLGVGAVRLQEVPDPWLRPDQHVLDEVAPGELEPAGDEPVHAEQA